MECYFGSFKRKKSDSSLPPLVCFSIPEAGIVFKAPFNGSSLHSQYASLLTLLEFVELNNNLFKGKKLDIYGNDLDLINQVNEKTPCRYEYSELLNKALDYKKKYGYSLGWIPEENNPSTDYLFD